MLEEAKGEKFSRSKLKLFFLKELNPIEYRKGFEVAVVERVNQPTIFWWKERYREKFEGETRLLYLE